MQSQGGVVKRNHKTKTTKYWLLGSNVKISEKKKQKDLRHTVHQGTVKGSRNELKLCSEKEPALPRGQAQGKTHDLWRPCFRFHLRQNRKGDLYHSKGDGD